MKESVICLVLGIGVALAGRLWVLIPLPWARAAAWVGLGLGVAVLSSLDLGPIARMLVFCCFLLAAMKALVYVEWAAPGRRLCLSRYLAFSFLWFGMDPGAFRIRRPGLEWRTHLRIGILCMLAGSLGALTVRNAGWTQLLLLFVPMSVGFHYGALRVLTGGWRRAGVPVRILFRNPLASTGLADFWSARWNLGYSQMMVRVVMRPVERFLGARGSATAVFVVSGILHEVAITLPVKAGYGLPTLYFVLQALAVEVERRMIRPRWRPFWAALWVVAPIGLLFPLEFQREIIIPCLRVLPEFSTS